jgi:hypothetical protein
VVVKNTQRGLLEHTLLRARVEVVYFPIRFTCRGPPTTDGSTPGKWVYPGIPHAGSFFPSSPFLGGGKAVGKDVATTLLMALSTLCVPAGIPTVLLLLVVF